LGGVFVCGLVGVSGRSNYGFSFVCLDVAAYVHFEIMVGSIYGILLMNMVLL